MTSDHTQRPRTLSDYHDLLLKDKLRNMGIKYGSSSHLDILPTRDEILDRMAVNPETGEVVSNEYSPTQNDNSSPKFSREEYESARASAADSIVAAIENDYPLKSVFVEYDRTGPMGGTSTQVTVASEGDSPDVVINIYSDGKIQEKVETFLKRKRQELIARKERKETLDELRDLEEE